MIYLAVGSLKIVWVWTLPATDGFFLGLYPINTLFSGISNFLIPCYRNIYLICKRCYLAQIGRQDSSAYTITDNLYLSTLENSISRLTYEACSCRFSCWKMHLMPELGCHSMPRSTRNPIWKLLFLMLAACGGACPSLKTKAKWMVACLGSSRPSWYLVLYFIYQLLANSFGARLYVPNPIT